MLQVLSPARRTKTAACRRCLSCLTDLASKQLHQSDNRPVTSTQHGTWLAKTPGKPSRWHRLRLWKANSKNSDNYLQKKKKIILITRSQVLEFRLGNPFYSDEECQYFEWFVSLPSKTMFTHILRISIFKHATLASSVVVRRLSSFFTSLWRRSAGSRSTTRLLVDRSFSRWILISSDTQLWSFDAASCFFVARSGRCVLTLSTNGRS